MLGDILPGCLVAYRRPSCLQQTLDGFFWRTGAAILVLFGAYQGGPDASIARVSREEREALEARQQAMMAEQQEREAVFFTKLLPVILLMMVTGAGLHPG